jgi:hypothetical protein
VREQQHGERGAKVVEDGGHHEEGHRGMFSALLASRAPLVPSALEAVVAIQKYSREDCLAGMA